MAQLTTGIRNVLSLSSVYLLLGALLGGTRARQRLINNFIRPQPGQRILDIGCGPAPLLEYLPEYVEYTGVDISEEYIAAARKNYGNRAVFHCCSLENMVPSNFNDFDLVLGIGLLHHLEEEAAERFFYLAASVLQADGCCLTLDGCRVPTQNPIARLLLRMDRGQNIRTAESYAALAETAFPVVNYYIRKDLLRLPYTHILMESRMGIKAGTVDNIVNSAAQSIMRNV